eukprot:TRINITY_DN1973_c0_g1_i1.p1 TRINITY_DN1973_c0_g1~~TRINITY_DN1973_c0_g1_i1.p1  ORF type:complete len:170 (+),score=38.72 TRINITY_DN1973_c0_g1_i1:83-592(+)
MDFNHQNDLYVFFNINIDLLDSIYSLETSAFPEDEAASLESLKNRINQAGNLFYGIKKKETDELIGYICSTLSDKETLEHDSMLFHIENGNLLCIHSVVIKEEYQRRGLATKMMTLYVEQMKSIESITKIQLLCKDNLKGLYTKCGFSFNRISPVQHGQDHWNEMELIP